MSSTSGLTEGEVAGLRQLSSNARSWELGEIIMYYKLLKVHGPNYTAIHELIQPFSSKSYTQVSQYHKNVCRTYGNVDIIFGPFLAHSQLNPPRAVRVPWSPYCPC